MAKLVVLTQSLAGRSCELAAERTTVGRIEENNFQIAEPSVSSRHCEILLRGSEVVVKDLNSTNGTFINGEKLGEGAEGVLKPGQTLRLGNVELKLDAPGAPAAPASSAPAKSSPPPKKEGTKAASGGVSLSELEGGRPVNVDTSVFSKKKKSSAGIFWIAVAVVMIVIVVLIFVLISKVKGP